MAKVWLLTCWNACAEAAAACHAGLPHSAATGASSQPTSCPVTAGGARCAEAASSPAEGGSTGAADGDLGGV